MRAGSKREVILTGCFLAILFNEYLVLDAFVALSLDWWFVASVLALAAMVGYPGLRRLAREHRVAVLLAFSAAVIGLRWVDLDHAGRKGFLRDLYSVRRGMTRSEVKAVMGKYRYLSREPGLGDDFYGYTNDSSWGIVVYESGRVARVDFSPD